MSTPATLPDALAARLRTDAAQPFVTFYDDATSERVELSVATYANWVAKTAGLLQEELDAERGGLVLVELPTHWLGAVWLAAAWSLGMAVTDEPSLVGEAALVVCGPDGVEKHARRAAAAVAPVVALSLRPLGGRFTEALPTGVVDYGAVVLAQPDVFAPYDPPAGTDPGWRDATGATSQADLLAAAGTRAVVGRGGRLLTDANPCSRGGIDTLLAPLVLDASAVWVRHPDPAGWPARADQERVTDELRAPR